VLILIIRRNNIRKVTVKKKIFWSIRFGLLKQLDFLGGVAAIIFAMLNES
jgi:hypothetical protein